MKKLIYFLLLIPFIGLGQVSTGQETQFDYGIQNLAPQTVTTPTYIGTAGTDGTLGIIPSAYIEKTAKKQNSMAVDGTGTFYPTVDAVNLQANTIAKTLTNVGLLEVGNDAFQMARQDDTHLNVTGTSLGVIFPSRYNTPPYAPSDAVRQVPTNTNYPLQNFLSYLPTSSTQGVFYIGWRDTTQAFELSTASFVQNPNVFQCGIIFLKNVAGTISFIDATRTVYAIPDVSQYSNLETTAIGVKSSVFLSPNTGGMTVKNSAGSIVGLSVCYKCANNDEKAIAANATTTFRRLNPGNATATVLPTAGTTVVTTDYWNGSAMVSLTANGNASVQRWLVTVLGTIILQAGEAQYTNFQEGKDNAYTATFTDIIPKGTFVEIGRLIAVKNASDLGNNSQAVFVSTGAGGGGGTSAEIGDMTTTTAQTVTGVKTFNDGTIGHRNVANTFTSFFTNSNTASRTYTLPDASGTIALASSTFSSYQSLNVSTYTFVLADANSYINNIFSGASTYTVPTNSVVAFPLGTKLSIHYSTGGASNFTLSGAGVTFVSPNGLLGARNGWFILTKTATDTWVVQSDVSSFTQSSGSISTPHNLVATGFVSGSSFFGGSVSGSANGSVLTLGANGMTVSGTPRTVASTSLSDTNTFVPTSGTAAFASYGINTTINQTGGASGISSGFYCNPTLTSAFDFRGLDIRKGSVVLPYVAQTATYSISNNDYLIDLTSGTFTATLPTAVGCQGKNYIVKNSGSGAITISTTSSQTIDGAASYSLPTQYKYVHVVSNGANWIITANN